MSITKIAMIGAAGRMGRRIISLAHEDERCEVVGALEYSESPFLGMDAGEVAGCGKIGVNITADIDEALKDCDVYIDFTGVDVTMANLEAYKRIGKPVIIASTGLTAEQTAKLEALSADMPVLFSANMSVGMNLTFKILEMVSKAIGEDWDIEIVEAHHRMKKDAPSGTAMTMGKVIADVLGRDIEGLSVSVLIVRSGCRHFVLEISLVNTLRCSVRMAKESKLLIEHTPEICSQRVRYLLLFGLMEKIKVFTTCTMSSGFDRGFKEIYFTE